MRIRSLMSVLLLSGVTGLAVQAQETDKAQDETKQQEGQEEETKELKLEELFPEKSFFGPSARSTSFSHDGAWGVYMYRPYIERRHGNDLWLVDSETGEVTRVTSAVVMAEFQESARKVVEDRTKKAKKAGVGQKDKNGQADDAEQQNDDATDQPAEDDGVTGRWEGRITGGEDLGLPPDGVAFVLVLQRHTDDSVTGTLKVSGEQSAASLSGGRYDADTGEVSGTFVDEGGDTTTAFSAIVRDDGIEGTLTVKALGVTLDLKGERTSRESGASQNTDAAEDEKAQDTDEQDEQEEKGDDEQEDIELGNWVSEKDADDEKAPRFAGIQTYTWSPTANELIFTSEGDLYRFNVDDRSITRLTKTEDYERSVEYLPDGSGYTYMSGNSVVKVAFGSHLIEQLDPRLPGGENMTGYELSPDGSRMVFLTRKVLKPAESRRVNIITYRDRFAQVRQVPRHVSDDELQEAETSIYLYDMRDPMHEEFELQKVYTHRYTGPRDILQVPEWAPNSEKVCFAVYTQETGNVEVYEASFPPRKEEDAEAGDAAGESGDDDSNGADADDSADETDEQDDAEEDPKEEEAKIEPAKLIYKFYHHGGPNTPRMIHPYYLADSHHITFLTEQSGFRHLHILDPTYEMLEQITSGHFEVYPFDISDDHRYLFCTSTKGDPTRDEVYVVDLVEKKMKRISQQPGTYSTVAISNDATKALANHVSYGELRELQFIDVEAESQTELTDSHPEKARELTEPTPEFFTYTNRQGHTIHGHMFKPADWTPEDRRPLLIYVYGGPLGTRKMVTDGSYNSAAYFFAYYMARKHGWVTCTIDPRGVSGYGALFEKSNFEQVGRPQVEDLVDGGKWFIENHGVDPDRIAMHGWSFGGFQTQMCLYTEPDFFAAGIAGAGPTEWENYNSWYSQGTIGETREGQPDLKKYSLLPLAKNLKANLLLVHGMEDANVLYQDTVRVYRELLKAGKEALVELFLDPTGGHGLGGDVETINRYRKYEAFLLQHVGVGGPAQALAQDGEEKEAEDAAGDPTIPH